MGPALQGRNLRKGLELASNLLQVGVQALLAFPRKAVGVLPSMWSARLPVDGRTNFAILKIYQALFYQVDMCKLLYLRNEGNIQSFTNFTMLATWRITLAKCNATKGG